MVSDLKSKAAGPGEDQAFWGVDGAMWEAICSVFVGSSGMAFWCWGVVERGRKGIGFDARKCLSLRILTGFDGRILDGENFIGSMLVVNV